MSSASPSPAGGDTDPTRKLPPWAGPFLAGSTLTVFGYSCRQDKQAKALEAIAQKQNEAAPTLASVSLSSGKTFQLVNTPSEAIAAIQRGQLKKEVVEIGDIGGQAYTYVFTSVSTNANKVHDVVLRGVPMGASRDAFLTNLKASGACTVAEVMPRNGMSAQPGTQIVIEKSPWYSPFVWPVVLLAGAILVSRIIGNGLQGLKSRLGGLGMDSGGSLQKFLERPKDRFSDVGGNRTVVAEMKAIVQEIKQYQAGTHKGHLPKGVLMSGEPGVGKTFMARVLCGEADCPMFYMNAGDLTSSSYMGAWTRAVKNLFAEARELRDKGTAELRSGPDATGEEEQAIVIFLDEFDSIGKSRGNSESHGEHERAVNTLLAEMDGVDEGKNRGIIIIAATNKADSLDPALKRPGRFTTQLKVPAPETAEERLDVLRKVTPRILKDHGLTLQDESVLAEIAKITAGTSPDHLRGMVQRAADLAGRSLRNTVARTDLFEAYQQTLFGHAREELLNPARLELVAAHEHGHGLAALACGRNPLIVSMKPRGDSLGRVVIDANPLTEAAATRNDLLLALVILAGGRAGEMNRFGVGGTSAGVTGDFSTMDSVSRRIIDTGMLDGTFGQGLAEAETWELPESYRQDVNRLGDSAVAVAREVINLAGPEVFAKIVTDSLKLKNELVGPEAVAFYSERVSQTALRDMQELVKKYLEDPLGWYKQHTSEKAGRTRSSSKAQR